MLLGQAEADRAGLEQPFHAPLAHGSPVEAREKEVVGRPEVLRPHCPRSIEQTYGAVRCVVAASVDVVGRSLMQEVRLGRLVPGHGCDRHLAILIQNVMRHEKIIIACLFDAFGLRCLAGG